MKYRYGIVFLILLFGCTRKVHFSNVVDKNKPFIIKTYTADFSEVISTSLETGSEKHDGMLAWMENHKSSWSPTKASYFGSALAGLYQDNFKFLVFETAVTISYVDKKFKLKQYKKKSALNEFDFLLD